MIDIELLNRARANWRKASSELCFEFISPYIIEVNGERREAFAFLPEYGSPNGTIICLTYAPNYTIDNEIIKWAQENKLFYSFIDIKDSLYYDKDYLTQTLEDWIKYK